MEDFSVPQQEHIYLRDEMEMSDLQMRHDTMQVVQDQSANQMGIEHGEIQILRQENMEQRDGHEALLCMVCANRLVVDVVEDRLAAEIRRGDELQRKFKEMQQFLRHMGMSSSPLPG